MGNLPIQPARAGTGTTVSMALAVTNVSTRAQRGLVDPGVDYIKGISNCCESKGINVMQRSNRSMKRVLNRLGGNGGLLNRRFGQVSHVSSRHKNGYPLQSCKPFLCNHRIASGTHLRYRLGNIKFIV